MSKRIAFLLVVFFAGFTAAKTQEQSLVEYLEECERKYGDDLDLVNGEKYFYPYSNTEGDPFLESSSRRTGIRIKGKSFEDQQIKYDIFNQQLVLEYEDIYGGSTSLVLRDEWVETFNYGPRVFKTVKGPDGNPGFYQLIYEGRISCYYRWSKEYQLNLASGVRNYFFSEPLRESFVVTADGYHQFRNNRSLIKIFDKEKQKEIKLFLRRTGVNVKRSPDLQITNLIEYINSLTDETS